MFLQKISWNFANTLPKSHILAIWFCSHYSLQVLCYSENDDIFANITFRFFNRDLIWIGDFSKGTCNSEKWQTPLHAAVAGMYQRKKNDITQLTIMRCK